MKRTFYILLFSFIVIIPILLGMDTPAKMTNAREKKGVIRVEREPNLEIHEGYVSQKEETILVKEGRKTVAKIHLSEPVMVAQAEQKEEWGFFQFPVMARAADGTLVIDWQMKADSHTTYHTKAERGHVPMVSYNEGKTWQSWDKTHYVVTDSYREVLKDGRVIQVYTPKSEDITHYKNLKAVAKVGENTYYRIKDLPEILHGVYIKIWDADLKNSRIIHSKLNDDEALRSAINGLMPIVWWGNIKEMKDGSLVAGTYPGYYLGEDGKPLPEGVSFYKSNDQGNSWRLISKIPYRPDYKKDPVAPYKADKGFCEPAFEVLADSTFICVVRTGGASPMYKSISKDRGCTWTIPEPFTPNGVKPLLMTLKNGTLVLVSGRPGVQVRFSLDGTGESWTEPIEMMPFMCGGEYDLYASCGYVSIEEADKSTFYITYSDFKQKNNKGDIRKTIFFRKITIDR